jgi:ADP-ribosylglycohydrolase
MRTASSASLLRNMCRAKITGAVLGAAIGDTMWHPTEFIGAFRELRRRYPMRGVRGCALWWERDGKRSAPYTVHTQMAELVLRSLLERLDLDGTIEHIAGGSCDGRSTRKAVIGRPNACLAGCRSLARGTHWSEAGGP